jgi:hypothetical protein
MSNMRSGRHVQQSTVIRFAIAVVFSFIGFPPLSAGATTIFAVRTPTEIYVGVDSKVKVTKSDGVVLYQERCKLIQIGSKFLTAAGPFEAPGLDMRASFFASQGEGGTLSQIARRFTNHYALAIDKSLNVLRRTSRAQYEQLISQPISVYIFGFDSNIPVAVEKRFVLDKIQPANSTNLKIFDNDCPPGCDDFGILFTGNANAMKGLSLDSLKIQSAVELIRERIELSIKSDPSDSGHPINIVRLTKDGGKWIQNEKHCPEISPY